MDIPASIQVDVIQDSFESQKLYFFKNTTHQENSPPHYHIAIKTKDSNYLLLTMFTTQVEKRKRYYRDDEKMLSSLVEISASNMQKINSNLNQDSCLDCNNPILKTSEELLAEIVPGTFRYVNAVIDEQLISDITEATKSSPRVRPFIKNLL